MLLSFLIRHLSQAGEAEQLRFAQWEMRLNKTSNGVDGRSFWQFDQVTVQLRFTALSMGNHPLHCANHQ